MNDEKMGGYHNQKNELADLRKALIAKETENEILRLAMTRIPKQTTLFHVRQECKDALAAIAVTKGEGGCT